MAEAEAVLVAYLKAAFPTARLCTETTEKIIDGISTGTDVIAVSRFGGSDDEVSTFDDCSMDFDCYSSTRPLARTLAYSVRSNLRNDAPGQTVAYVDSESGATIRAFVARVQSISGPAWTPYTNTKVRRFTYSAQIRLHSLEA